MSANASVRGRAHSWCFWNRGLVGALLFGPIGSVILFSNPLVAHDSFTDDLLEASGWSFFLLYVLFRVWATMYVGDRKEKDLVTEGPYSLCRNPLYLGSLCWAVALVLLLHSATLMVALIIAAWFYCRRVIPSEEAVLRSQFGEKFDQYSQVTPRLLPKLSGYHSTGLVQVRLAGMRRELKRMLTSFVLMLSVFALCHLRGLRWWPHVITLP